MSSQFSPVDLDVQMRIKSVFDPTWRLNPAKVFPLAATEPMRAGRPASMPEVA
jgi:glycolate oxidase